MAPVRAAITAADLARAHPDAWVRQVGVLAGFPAGNINPSLLCLPRFNQVGDELIHQLFIAGTTLLRMRFFSILLLMVLVFAPGSGYAEPNAAMRQRVCLGPAEAREAIAAHRLAEPFPAMRNAANQMHAEAVGERLCRWNEQYVYEITLLRRDGRVIRVFVDAASGKPVGSINDR
jgi:hypothetical protein